MTFARTQYRRNHSDIRALARHARDPSKRLRDVCEDRKFWFGNTWAQPASSGAQAALRTLMGRYRGTDPLRLASMLPAECRTNENLKAIHRVLLGSLRLHTRA